MTMACRVLVNTITLARPLAHTDRIAEHGGVSVRKSAIVPTVGAFSRERNFHLGIGASEAIVQKSYKRLCHGSPSSFFPFDCDLCVFFDSTAQFTQFFFADAFWP